MEFLVRFLEIFLVLQLKRTVKDFKQLLIALAFLFLPRGWGDSFNQTSGSEALFLFPVPIIFSVVLSCLTDHQRS